MGQGALGQHRRALGQHAPTAEDALNHLLLTTDVEQLYRSLLLSLQRLEVVLFSPVLAHLSPWMKPSAKIDLRFERKGGINGMPSHA